MPPKPNTSQICNTQACAPTIECKSQRGSSVGRFCGNCYVSCQYGDCYFLHDRISGEFHYFWGNSIGVTSNWAELQQAGYRYFIGPSQLWYDGYEWVWEICRSPL